MTALSVLSLIAGIIGTLYAIAVSVRVKFFERRNQRRAVYDELRKLEVRPYATATAIPERPGYESSCVEVCFQSRSIANRFRREIDSGNVIGILPEKWSEQLHGREYHRRMRQFWPEDSL